MSQKLHFTLCSILSHVGHLGSQTGASNTFFKLDTILWTCLVKFVGVVSEKIFVKDYKNLRKLVKIDYQSQVVLNLLVKIYRDPFTKIYCPETKCVFRGRRRRDSILRSKKNLNVIPRLKLSKNFIPDSNGLIIVKHNTVKSI